MYERRDERRVTSLFSLSGSRSSVCVDTEERDSVIGCVDEGFCECMGFCGCEAVLFLPEYYSSNRLMT